MSPEIKLMKTIRTLKYRGGILFTCLLLLLQSNAFAVTNTFSGTGNWTTAADWSAGVPAVGQDIVIAGTCTINGALTISLNSLTVNSGKTLNLSASTINITATNLTVSGTCINTGFTVILNATTVNVNSGSDFDLGNNASSTTNLNISGNLTCTGTYIQHTTGGSTGNINFNGSNVIQQWNCSTTFGDKIFFTINGTHNSLKLLTAMALSPKATVTVNSGDTIDCQTFLVSGMTNAAGGVTISSGAIIKIGSATGLNGNVSTGNGGNSFSAGATYIYSATGATGSQVTGSLLPASIANLIIHNTSTSNGTDVSLSQTVNVTTALTLQNGIVITTPTKLLNITAGSSSTSGNVISFVDGPMTKAGNTSFVFPTGNGTVWARVGISAPSLSATITAQYKHTAYTNLTPVNAPLANVSSLEYWLMSENINSSVTVTLYWESGAASRIYTYSTPALLVADYTTGSWHSLGGSSVTGGPYPGPGTITASTTISGNFTSMPVTFGSNYTNSNPLPITLTSFTATYLEESKSVLIDWTVAAQLNNKQFVVEKTLDGVNYSEVATRPGAGTIPFSKSYSAIDNKQASGISYYRLKQIDVDGNSAEFTPAAVFIESTPVNSLVMYPNPVVENAILTYRSENTLPLTITITDLRGKQLNSYTYNNIVTGENNFNLYTSNLSRGMYILHATNNQESYSLKFIKQ